MKSLTRQWVPLSWQPSSSVTPLWVRHLLTCSLVCWVLWPWGFTPWWRSACSQPCRSTLIQTEHSPHLCMDVSHSVCYHVSVIFSQKQNKIFARRQAFTRFLSWLLLVWGKCYSKLFSNTRWCMSVAMSCNIIGHMINFGYLLADVKPLLLFSILHWQMLLPKFTVADHIVKTYGRCYCHISVMDVITTCNCY